MNITAAVLKALRSLDTQISFGYEAHKRNEQFMRQWDHAMTQAFQALKPVETAVNSVDMPNIIDIESIREAGL